MFSTFIKASLQLFARVRVSNCNREKQQREENHQKVHIKVLNGSQVTDGPSKLHHDRESQRRFIVPQVRAET